MTPIGDPQTRMQQLYDEAHIRTRNSVERTIGVWKRRFPVLAYGCRLQLSTVLAVIPATAVLHNVAILNNEKEPPVEENAEFLNYLIQTGNIPEVPNNGKIMGVHRTYRNEVVNYFEQGQCG